MKSSIDSKLDMLTSMATVLLDEIEATKELVKRENRDSSFDVIVTSGIACKLIGRGRNWLSQNGYPEKRKVNLKDLNQWLMLHGKSREVAELERQFEKGTFIDVLA